MARIGGGGVGYLFHANAAQTLIVKTKGGSTEVDALVDAAIKLGGDDGDDILIQTDITYNDDGSVNFGIAHTKFDKTLTDFEKIAVPRKASAGGSDTEELKSETGYAIGGDGISSDDVLFVYMGVGAVDSLGKRPINLSVGYFKKSYKRSYSGGKFVQTPYTFQSIATIADMVLPAVVFESWHGTAGTPALDAAERTIATDYHEQIAWCDINAS